MSTMTGDGWTKPQMLELIHAYKEEQCLYNTKNKNYHNKPARSEALLRVFQRVKKIRSNLSNAKECHCKFSNMRNMFNVENVKRLSSTRTAIDTDDIYVPSLWYFKHLLFLEEFYMPRKNKTIKLSHSAESTKYSHIVETTEVPHVAETIKVPNVPETVAYLERGIESETESQSQTPTELVRPPSTSSSDTNRTSISSRRFRQKREKLQETDPVLALVSECLSSSRAEDQFDIVGKNVATKLRSVSREQRIYAEKLINDVLFEAELGNLDRNCKVLMSLPQQSTTDNIQFCSPT